MGIKWKQHSAEFKARVAMAAFSKEKTVAALAAELFSFSGSYVTLCWSKPDSNSRSHPLTRRQTDGSDPPHLPTQQIYRSR